MERSLKPRIEIVWLCLKSKNRPLEGAEKGENRTFFSARLLSRLYVNSSKIQGAAAIK